jgi:hypothetical protein
MFEKSLHDMVKGIRGAKSDLPAYLAATMKEIKDELKSRDVVIKAQALQKMTAVSFCTCPFLLSLLLSEGGLYACRL